MQILGEIGQWFGQQPPISKWLLVFSLAIPVGVQLGAIPVNWVYYDWRYIVLRLQVWRAFTCLFLAKPSISFVFNCFFRFQYSVQLEMASGKFKTTADYLYFLVLTSIGLNVLHKQF
jgi:membrane associated rhomboid family serine protease